MNSLDLISSSLRLINVLASGETPSANEANDALVILQQMLDSWQAERMNVFTININEFPLVAGQQVYTVGTGGNFNMPRPAKVERVSIIWLANPAQPLELPLSLYNDQEWQQKVPIKLINSTIPTILYDDGAFPLRNFNYWPVPTVVDNTRIYSWQALNTFPDLVTDVTFPPGYLKALRYNLAVDLAPEFGRPIPPEVVAQALSSKAIIKAMNAPAPISSAEDALVTPEGGHFDWRSDSYGGRR